VTVTQINWQTSIGTGVGARKGGGPKKASADSNMVALAPKGRAADNLMLNLGRCRDHFVPNATCGQLP
jgi:hypothetical protein